ncbi:MAG TPA: tetraacyldisaccharide 4'-kinase [Pyrinomonadaceae bacterium]|nr:tetraacyldisaccharide 4'-kinase [Pyrinomonadaceae bacterium]
MKESQGIILAPLGVLYSAVTRARRALYKRRILKSNKISAPVISIGNITTGGTGKTPLVEWVARAVSREGRRVCILTRGYARKNEGSRVVVSDGEHILADAREGGDEPRLLAESLQGIASVISDADRTSAARYAIEKFKSEVFILDDGFQHLRIARDLDIVTVDATNPWGGERLLPMGRLREPLRELRRADLIILTRAEQAQDILSLRKQTERLSNGCPVILSRTRTKLLRPLTETTESDPFESSLHPSALIPHPFVAFCAIGNPSAFFKQIQSDGYKLKLTRSFPDHHAYTQTEVDEIVYEAKQVGAEALMTTVKDAVKLRSLRFDLPCYVLEIELEFDDEEKLTTMLREAIAE